MAGSCWRPRTWRQGPRSSKHACQSSPGRCGRSGRAYRSRCARGTQSRAAGSRSVAGQPRTAPPAARTRGSVLCSRSGCEAAITRQLRPHRDWGVVGRLTRTNLHSERPPWQVVTEPAELVSIRPVIEFTWEVRSATSFGSCASWMSQRLRRPVCATTCLRKFAAEPGLQETGIKRVVGWRTGGLGGRVEEVVPATVAPRHALPRAELVMPITVHLCAGRRVCTHTAESRAPC